MATEQKVMFGLLYGVVMAVVVSSVKVAPRVHFMGEDPATWSPTTVDGRAARLGEDPATWSQTTMDGRSTQLGGDPATWTPLLTADPTLIGEPRGVEPTDPLDTLLPSVVIGGAPRVVARQDEPDATVPAAARPGAPLLGEDPATWSPTTLDGRATRLGDNPATWSQTTLDGRSTHLGDDPSTWSPLVTVDPTLIGEQVSAEPADPIATLLQATLIGGVPRVEGRQAEFEPTEWDYHCTEDRPESYLIRDADACTPAQETEDEGAGDRYYFGPCEYDDDKCVLKTLRKCRHSSDRDNYCLGRDAHFCSWTNAGEFVNYFQVQCG